MSCSQLPTPRLRPPRLGLPACSWPVLLILGFLAQLALIFFVTMVGLGELEATDARLRVLTDQHAKRLELTKIMQANARERTISLARMTNLHDLFEHDAEQQRFHAYGREFMAARRTLLAMPLSPPERQLLERQWQLTLEAMPHHHQVIDLSLGHRFETARDVLTQQAIPAQDAVLRILSQLDDLTRQAASQALREATQAHDTARRWMIVLSALALLLGLLIASMVVRMTHRIGLERERLATHDALTGLPNRTLLLDRLEQAILRARRQRNRVGVLFLDLDGFKAVNDSLGHAAGDEVLRLMAERLRQVVRANDIIARLGGDEFVIGLVDAGHQEQIEQVSRKLLHAVCQPLALAGEDIRLSCSVGACIYPEDGKDAKGLLRCADFAMYAAKKAGKNQIRHFSHEVCPEALAGT